MSKGLEHNDMRSIERALQYGVPVYAGAAGASFWSGVPRFLRGVLGGAVLWAAVGCAVQSDRTSDLLELELADRDAAISRLEAEDRAAPAAWSAYSLGVLFAADGDYAAMDHWFTICAERGDLYDGRMAALRRDHWRRWARQADDDFAAGRWAEAERACTLALDAEPGHEDTELRRTEASVMAHGPTPIDLAVLTAADRTAVADRWLEAVAAGAVEATTVEGVATALAAAPTLPIGAFILGELARCEPDYAAMARWYAATGGVLDDAHRGAMAAGRAAAHELLLNEALIAWSAGDQAACLGCLDTADLVRPGDDSAAQIRARAVVLAAADSPEAVARVLTDPSLDDAWLEAWLGRLRARGRADEAIVVCDALLMPSRGTDPQLIRRARLARASLLADRGAWDAAAFDLRALLEPPSGDAADDVAVATALGDVLLNGSRWEDAARWYGQAAAWNGDDAELCKRQARAAFGAGRWDELLRHAEAAVALAPADAEARRLLEQAQLLAVAAAEVAP